MKTLPKLALLACWMTVALGAQAATVPFTVTAATLAAQSGSGGSGYGTDTGQNPENGGTLLDVAFTTVFAGATGSLTNVNDSFTFKIGTVNFREPNTGSGGNIGIRTGEDDNLGVTASFTFTNPLGVTQTLFTNGTATLGRIDDNDVDYSINWDPIEVHFGLNNSGIFQIDLLDLAFSANGVLDETATITLTHLEDAAPGTGVVPEPASLALLGLGLGGIAFMRRKVSA